MRSSHGRPVHHGVGTALVGLALLTGATGTLSGGGTPGAPASSAQPAPSVKAVPIVTRAPSWFTPTLYRRVIAAGSRGVSLAAAQRMARTSAGKSKGGGGGSGTAGGANGPCLYTGGAGPTTFTSNPAERPPVGIGPGTWLLSVFCSGGAPNGFAWCTANFVFQNGTSYGLGTAGHCAAKDALGSPVTAVVQPPPEVCAAGGSCAPGLYAIGTFAIAHNNGLGDDFALIKLYPQFNSWVRPTMPVFGGPTGSYTGGLQGTPAQTISAGPATVLAPAFYPALVGHCGHGAVVGTGGTCRTSAGLFASGTWFAWYGASTPGDSGSGVEILGNYSGLPGNAVPAAADLTHIIILDASVSGKGTVTEGPDQPAMIAGTQMSKILQIVGSSWKLVPGGAP